MKSKTIYWASINQVPPFDFSLNPLIPYISKSQSEFLGSNHVSCPAVRGKNSNTFFSTFPYDISIKIYKEQFLASDTLLKSRQGLYPNSYAFDWYRMVIFFSFTKQVMEVTPAYLHKTSYSQYGHAPSGKFDISKWFRPCVPNFQLWEGETEFKAKKGEAHLYFNFPHEGRVELQEFKMSKRLSEIMLLCTHYKDIKPKQSLDSIYKMFKETGLQDETIEEIKANLITPKL